MAIARGIIEAHGGRIWIEDAGAGGNVAEVKNNPDGNHTSLEKPRGSRVVFTLPVGDEEDDPVHDDGVQFTMNFER